MKTNIPRVKLGMFCLFFLFFCLTGCGITAMDLTAKNFKIADNSATCRYTERGEPYLCGKYPQCHDPEYYNRQCIGPQRFTCCRKVAETMACKTYECMAFGGTPGNFSCADKIECTGKNQYGLLLYTLSNKKGEIHTNSPLFKREKVSLCNQLCGPGEWVPDSK